MKRIAWSLAGLAIVAAIGFAVWPLTSEQYALGLVTGILIGGGTGMRLAERRKSSKEAKP